MTIHWTHAALSDLWRLYEFLRPVSQQAAARVVQRFTDGPDLMLMRPRVRTKLPEFAPREVRYISVGDA